MQLSIFLYFYCIFGSCTLNTTTSMILLWIFYIFSNVIHFLCYTSSTLCDFANIIRRYKEEDRAESKKEGNLLFVKISGSPGKFLPIYISIRYIFIELYRCHFLPQAFSIFRLTWIFHPSTSSQVFQRETFQHDRSCRPSSLKIATNFPGNPKQSDVIRQKKNSSRNFKLR